MQLKLAFLLAITLPLALIQGVSAEDPELPIVGAIIIEGEGAWLGEFCMQTEHGVYLWDRPVCGMGSECQNGGANIYILTEDTCADETCQGDLFIFLLSEGNCSECDGEVINPGVANCRGKELIAHVLG